MTKTEVREKSLTERILEGLVSGGAITDKSGRASSVLLDRVDPAGSMTWLTTRVKSLEEDGYIKREVNGKRTLSIRATDRGKRFLADLQSGAIEEPAVHRSNKPRPSRAKASTNGSTNHTTRKAVPRPRKADPVSAPLATLGTDVEAELVVRLEFGGQWFEADWDSDKFTVMGVRLVDGDPELELGWTDENDFVNTISLHPVS